jgi:hypothetical protein
MDGQQYMSNTVARAAGHFLAIRNNFAFGALPTLSVVYLLYGSRLTRRSLNNGVNVDESEDAGRSFDRWSGAGLSIAFGKSRRFESCADGNRDLRSSSHRPELESLLFRYAISTELPNHYQDSSEALNTSHINGYFVRSICATGEGAGLGI